MEEQITAVTRLNIPKVIEKISLILSISIEKATEKFYNSVTYNVLKDIN